MKWSFRIARVLGIDIKVHITFFLILLLGAMNFAHEGAAGMLFGVLLMLLLFLCVTLHELGHSVVAIHFGIPVREIILLPIGGVAFLGKNVQNPRHELLIAIAGPLVNVVIAGALLALVGLTPLRHHAAEIMSGNITPNLPSMVAALLGANIMLVAFNLIPAFPLDGGRVLRAILAMLMPHAKATRIAVKIGQFAAVLMGIYAVMAGAWVLAVIALFIFLGASAETAQTHALAVLETLRVGDAYNRYALTLTSDDRVSKVVHYLLTSYQPDFAVLSRGQLQGIVTRNDVLQRLGTDSYDVYVTEIMHENFPRVQANQTLEQVREQLQSAGLRVAAVFDQTAFLGLVSLEDIAEAYAVLTFQQRLSQRPLHHAPVAPPPLPTEKEII